LAKLDRLIALLSAERQSLQAQSDAIVYPVLSLPPEITAEIFLRCLLFDTTPRPSPSKAPLLLAQICRQWRQIALDTPALWRSLRCTDETPVELFRLWLSRSGSLPLDLSLSCPAASHADALVEASLLHSHHWQDVRLELPVASFQKLDFRHTSVPMLRTISLEKIFWTPNEPAVVVIPNAPSLREAHLSIFPDVNVDIPWRQMTSLTLHPRMDFMECISLLRGCAELVNLSVYTIGSAVDHPDLITLNSLESLTCNCGGAFLLERLILPGLEHLALLEAAELGHAAALKSFILRSGSPLRSLSVATGRKFRVTLDTVIECLRAVPDSVSDLELIGKGGFPTGLSTALQTTDLLPQLKTFHFRAQALRSSHDDYQNLVDMLHARLQFLPPRAALDLATIHLIMRGAHERPNSAIMTQLRALISAGLKVKFTMSGKLNDATHVVLDSCTT